LLGRIGKKRKEERTHLSLMVERRILLVVVAEDGCERDLALVE
jgi:hypothetical protein